MGWVLGDSSAGLFSLRHLTSAKFYHSADKQGKNISALWLKGKTTQQWSSSNPVSTS